MENPTRSPISLQSCGYDESFFAFYFLSVRADKSNDDVTQSDLYLGGCRRPYVGLTRDEPRSRRRSAGEFRSRRADSRNNSSRLPAAATDPRARRDEFTRDDDYRFRGGGEIGLVARH